MTKQIQLCQEKIFYWYAEGKEEKVKERAGNNKVEGREEKFYDILFTDNQTKTGISKYV